MSMLNQHCTICGGPVFKNMHHVCLPAMPSKVVFEEKPLEPYMAVPLSLIMKIYAELTSYGIPEAKPLAQELLDIVQGKK
jgi:hypothetical protein